MIDTINTIKVDRFYDEVGCLKEWAFENYFKKAMEDPANSSTVFDQICDFEYSLAMMSNAYHEILAENQNLRDQLKDVLKKMAEEEPKKGAKK